MKIEAGIATRTHLGGQAPSDPLTLLRAASDPMVVLLFGKKPPRLVDKRKYGHLKKTLRKLQYLKEEISDLMGIAEGTFSLELCEGDNAFVTRDGQIAFGTGLLEKHQQDDDFLIGVLAHEMGHQPWTWPTSDVGRLTRAARNELHREEEAKADRFAGKALADLGAAPDSICNRLLADEAFEAAELGEYYPAKIRAKMIRAAFRRRAKLLERMGHDSSTTLR